jgi:D-alanyl-D-alanine carboxypeptidase
MTVALAVLMAFAQPADARRARHHHRHAAHGGGGHFSIVSASIVIDADSGAVLHAINPDTRSYPASLTKAMTLYLLFDELDKGRLRLDTKLPVSAHASAQAPSKLGLEPGDKISVQDIILALVTKSANDAAVVAAEGIGGTEANFAQMMTRKARALGMLQTNYQNASGLPNTAQVSTVRDQAILGRALVRDHPDDYAYFSTRQFTWQGQTINSHNRLMLNYAGADGIKTGYIHASGFNLIASAKRDGRRIIGVVFGGSTGNARDHFMATLLDKGFARLKGGNSTQMAKADEADLPDVEEVVAAAQAAKATGPMPAQTVALVKPTAAKVATPAKAKPTKVAMRAAKAADDRDDDDDDDALGDTDPSPWSIQVGAFGEYRPAHKAATEAAKRLGGLITKATIDVDKAKQGRQTVYRARLSGFNEDQARAACKKLERARKACKVVNPNA